MSYFESKGDVIRFELSGPRIEANAYTLNGVMIP